IDCLPNPIVIAVDINRQQSDIAINPSGPNDIIDIVPGDECALGTDVVPPINFTAADPFDVLNAAVDDKPRPIILDYEKPCVGLNIILNAEFDEGLFFHGDMANKELQDTVLTPLREHAKLSLVNSSRCLGLPSLDSANGLLKISHPRFDQIDAT